MFRIKSFLSIIIIAAMLIPDAVRCMQDNETEEFPITHLVQRKESPSLNPLEKKNTSTTGNSPENSDSFDDSLSPRKIEVTEVKMGNNTSGNSPTKELDKTSSEDKTEKSDSGGASPQKTEQIPNEEIIKITPLNQEITSLSLENKKGEQTQNPIIIMIGGDESQKFNAKMGDNEGKGSPLFIDIQKGVQEHNRSIILRDPTTKGDTKSSKKNHSGMVQIGNVIYLDGEKEEKEEEWEDWNKKGEKKIDLFSPQSNKKLKKKEKGESTIFLIEEEEISSDKNSSQQPTQKKQMVVEFLKDSFSKLNESFEKSVSIDLKKESGSNSKPLLINEDEELTEESHLLLKKESFDIEKEDSNQQKSLEESLKDTLTEDEEKTVSCFEEWLEAASEKTLCDQLDIFLKRSTFLDKLFAEDLKKLLEETSGLQKLTVKD